MTELEPLPVDTHEPAALGRLDRQCLYAEPRPRCRENAQIARSLRRGREEGKPRCGVEGLQAAAEQSPRRLSRRKRIIEDGKVAAGTCKRGELEQGKGVAGRGRDDPFGRRFIERRRRACHELPRSVPIERFDREALDALEREARLLFFSDSEEN